MKKLLLYIGVLAVMVLGSIAHSSAEQPNRLLIVNQNGNYSGLTLENLEQVALRNVEGDVFVDVEILDVIGLDTVKVKMTKSLLCETYSFTIAPDIVVKNMNDLSLKNYVQSQGSGTRYDTNFVEGLITGISLKPGTEYALIVVAYDNFGTAAGVTVAKFETEPPVIVGNPVVTHEMTKQTKDEFVITFYPNEDVGGYYVMGFEEGSVEEYLSTWGPWMGVTTISELIEIWNAGQPPLMDVTTYTFNRQNDFYPGELYDIVVAIKDVNGNFITPDIFTASTLVNGGYGEAFVDVTLEDYHAEIWDGDLKPSQFIKFTPNSETFRYRTTVQYAEDYDLYTPEEWEEDLCQNPPQVGIDGWFWYDEFTNEYQLDTNTEFVILTAAQNANREWGPVNVVRYTTPATCPGMSDTKSVGAKRAPKIEDRHPQMQIVRKGAVMPEIQDKIQTQILKVK